MVTYMYMYSLVKLDLHTGATAAKWTAPKGFYLVSEPTFVPRVGSEVGDGDEGYLMVFIYIYIYIYICTSIYIYIYRWETATKAI